MFFCTVTWQYMTPSFTLLYDFGRLLVTMHMVVNDSFQLALMKFWNLHVHQGHTEFLRVQLIICCSTHVWGHADLENSSLKCCHTTEKSKQILTTGTDHASKLAFYVLICCDSKPPNYYITLVLYFIVCRCTWSWAVMVFDFQEFKA